MSYHRDLMPKGSVVTLLCRGTTSVLVLLTIVAQVPDRSYLHAGGSLAVPELKMTPFHLKGQLSSHGENQISHSLW